MAGSEPLIQEADPHFMKLTLGARMSYKMVQKSDLILHSIKRTSVLMKLFDNIYLPSFSKNWNSQEPIYVFKSFQQYLELDVTLFTSRGG